MSYDYDLIAIGGGSGGLAVSNRAASYGARCLIVERDAVMGGTCVNRGCVPKKMMWYAASIAHALHDAPGYGFEVDTRGFDWKGLVHRREAHIRNINNYYDRSLAGAGVVSEQGMATLVDAHTVSIDKRQVTAERIVLAPGGEPVVPAIPGAELGITSDGFFELEEQPRSALVLGAGYIAVELAGLLQALGTRTTLGIRRDRFLRGFDDMLSSELADAMSADGLDLVTGFTAASLAREADGIVATGTDGRRLAAVDCVIFAIGRRPLSAELGLANAGVQVGCVRLHSGRSLSGDQCREYFRHW